MAKKKSKAKKKSSRRSIPRPRIDFTKAPSWWLTKPDEIREFLESLRGVEVEEIGKTAGGRPIIAAFWGEKEMMPGRTSKSLASSIAGGDPETFYGKGERKRQSLMFVGASHGTEVEGTVAALNFMNILVKGKDLLGRRQTELAREGRKHRFVLIPIQNVAGRERALDHVHWINVNPDYMSMISQGSLKNGEILSWPSSKLMFPIPLDQSDILGTYYNDAGVNLVYDTPHGADIQPENAALIRLCRQEMPDCAIFSHSNNGSLIEPPSAYIPDHFKQRSDQIAAVVGLRCARNGFFKSRVPQSPKSYAGEQFYQTDAIYHACGALPLLVEFPCGWQNVPDNHRDILDIGLTVIGEIAAYGAAYRFRPKDPRWK